MDPSMHTRREPSRLGELRGMCGPLASVRPVTRLVAIAAAAHALIGCASPTYNFRTEELVLDAASVADAGSYAFAVDPTERSEDEEPSLADLHDEIRAALDKELAARGWTLASPETADVVVAYTIGSASGASRITEAHLGRYSTMDANATQELAYVDQTLTVDLFTEPSGESIWRGQAVARLYGPIGEARAEVVNQAVAQLIGQLDDDL